MRDGGPRHPLLGTDHPGRMRRHLPGLQPRLLWMFRPVRIGQHRSVGAWWKALGVADDDWIRALRTYNVNAPEFARASGAEEEAT